MLFVAGYRLTSAGAKGWEEPRASRPVPGISGEQTLISAAVNIKGHVRVTFVVYEWPGEKRRDGRPDKS